eukprot:4642221-Prorocentrum_lima.AAC.1
METIRHLDKGERADRRRAAGDADNQRLADGDGSGCIAGSGRTAWRTTRRGRGRKRQASGKGQTQGESRPLSTACLLYTSDAADDM